MSALPLHGDDLATARALLTEAQALVARASSLVQQVRDVQPRNRKGHLMPGALNVWGVQNCLTAASLALGRGIDGLDRLVVPVPIGEVRNGLTRSCGTPACDTHDINHRRGNQ